MHPGQVNPTSLCLNHKEVDAAMKPNSADCEVVTPSNLPIQTQLVLFVVKALSACINYRLLGLNLVLSCSHGFYIPSLIGRSAAVSL